MIAYVDESIFVLEFYTLDIGIVVQFKWKSSCHVVKFIVVNLCFSIYTGVIIIHGLNNYVHIVNFFHEFSGADKGIIVIYYDVG